MSNNTTNTNQQQTQPTPQQIMRQTTISPFVKQSMKAINTQVMKTRSLKGTNRFTGYHAYMKSGAPRETWKQFKNVANK
jgi:hypothetical protein